ncbi:YihY/virulence factor BrkB family protein [Pseudooctadecabacter sp.]|uniref:YihY/virulence factor BrkB family protein n=1 Tax=Pseudooctadecabacter sp. TaxID=1966338 RepID=UPI0025D2AE23|nr:YihY/virulence factor BrkB family protein [Pseudooctadecabacter sp.]
MPRGRAADKPTEIPAKGWKDILWRVKDEIADDRVSLIAAGVAFYGFLAIFPAIAALMALSGLFLEPSDITDQISALAGLVPQDIVDIILEQATAVTGSSEGGLGLAALLSLLLAIYSASKGVGSLMDGLNVAYDEKEERGFIKLKAVTLGLTALIIAGLLLALVVVAVLPAVVDFFRLGPVGEPLVLVLSFVVLAALTMAGLAVLYRYGPSRDAAEWSWVSLGGLVGCALWIVASAGFAFYVSSFGSYNESFGALAGVVILLTWLWMSVFIVLIGAELNAEMEAQTRRDTTQGQDVPMGHRDAEKADTLGEAQT